MLLHCNFKLANFHCKLEFKFKQSVNWFIKLKGHMLVSFVWYFVNKTMFNKVFWKWDLSHTLDEVFNNRAFVHSCFLYNSGPWCHNSKTEQCWGARQNWDQDKFRIRPSSSSHIRIVRSNYIVWNTSESTIFRAIIWTFSEQVTFVPGWEKIGKIRKISGEKLVFFTANFVYNFEVKCGECGEYM